MLRKIRNLGLLILAFSGFSSICLANSSFETWLADFRQEARDKGISARTLDKALKDISPIPRVIELDRKQPEGTITFAQYQQRVISKDRINKGRRLMCEHREELEKASARYGVPPAIIVALWGIETSYGQNTGGFGIVPALATLAYDGRRSEFFRGELLKALQILDEGHIDLAHMKGSWAGAMGQNQFMPSSFHRFAVDGNNDGRRDIWTSLPDVFASTANYLGKSGWNPHERWGREVRLPKNFRQGRAGLDIRKSLHEWGEMGLTLPDKKPLPVAAGINASLILPDGDDGPAFLVYDNYRVIMSWNKSVYFATSVGILADQISQ